MAIAGLLVVCNIERKVDILVRAVILVHIGRAERRRMSPVEVK